MHAYDDREIPAGATVKAVWIVDDDRSIRWVLEKALAREGILWDSSFNADYLGSACRITLPASSNAASQAVHSGSRGRVMTNPCRVVM